LLLSSNLFFLTCDYLFSDFPLAYIFFSHPHPQRGVPDEELSQQDNPKKYTLQNDPNRDFGK